jgi:hypothetical protein
LAGNRGDWYLEVLGIDPNPQGSAARDAARSQTAEMTFTLESGPESLSLPTPLEPPGSPAAPSALDATEDDAEDLSGWKPDDLAKQVQSKRNFRWSIVITLGIVVAIAVAAVIYLPTTVETEASEEADAYAAVLDQMRATLPDIQQALASATEPATGAIDLLPLSAQLTRLDAAANEVVTRAARALPDTLPLVSRGPLEDLEPTRSRMKELGDDGAAIVARIAQTISYRTALEGVLVYPSLPVRADPSQINGISVSLAETLAQSSAVLTQLPLEAAFDTHRLQATAAVESFGEWQDAYLDALGVGDQAAAAALIDDAAALRAGVFSAIVPALANIRSEVDAAILDLNADVTDAIGAIPR